MDLEIAFYDVGSLERNLKATTHKSGKLGFTIEAAKKLELEAGKGLRIGFNTKNEDDKSLYVIVFPEGVDNTFRVNKAGLYYYVNTKPLFDKLGIEYKKSTVIYDISEEKYNGGRLFKFTRREVPKKTLKDLD
jgi:hypothetical protein